MAKVKEIKDMKKLSSGDAVNLLHELETHQIELEMQNEELRRAINELEEVRNRYSDLYDFSPIGYFTFDRNGSIHEVNLTGAKKLGVERANLLKKPFSMYINGNKDVFFSHLQKFFKTEKQMTCELRLVDKKGHQFEALLEIIPVHDCDGNLMARTAMSDITERKEVEKKMHETFTLVNSITEGSTDAIYAKDIKGRYLLFNKEASRFTGKEPDEVIGKDDYALFPAREAKIVMDGDRKVMESAKTMTYEEVVTTTKGIITFLSTKGPLFDSNGKVVGLFGIARDITERKQMEFDLKKNEERLLNAQKTAHLGNWEWNIKTNELFWSRENYNIFGLSLDVKPAMEPWLKVLHPDDLEFVKKSMDEALSGKPYDIDMRIIKPGGEVRILHALGEVEFDKVGKPVRMFGTVQDITERKKSEEIFRENERLIYSSKAKNEFLSKMSHELRTPLNAVIGFSELLKMKELGNLTEKQEHYVDNIRYGGKHLLNLISDILDLSKIDAGKMELVIKNISVPETLNQTIVLVEELAKEKKVVIKKELDSELDFIEADKQRFIQILSNLLSNAIKYNRETGGTITVTTKREGNMANFSVSDTGIGIKEEDLNKLFIDFEQLDSGISRKYEGTGLGLAITKKLIEMHGGKIWVESEFGAGTTVSFLLPIKANT